MRKGTDRSPSLPFLYHNPRASPLAAGCYAFF